MLSKYEMADRVVWQVTKTTAKKFFLEEQYDAVVPLISPEIITEPIVLINPYHAPKSFSHTFRGYGKKVIIDSGGFQMLRGTADFVHPDELLVDYNKYGDICMPLDLPLPASVEPYYFDAVTKMMKANDDYMLPKLDKDKVLALISQGSTVANRLKRLEGLKRTSSVVAIAGLNTLVDGDMNHKFMTALTNGMAVMDLLRKDTEYFHFLGVTSNFWVVLYAILAGTGYVKKCGGDSVSFRMASINGSYNFGLGGSSGRVEDISRKQKTPLGTLCRCPVCTTIPDLRCFLDSRVIESHNVWNAIEVKNLIADSVEVYLAGGCTLRDIADQWLPSGKYELLARAVDYINVVIQKGYREWKPKVTNNLFAGQKASKPNGLEHYEKIIGRYEAFHKKKFIK
jgi:queuine/archaeosine tRNA-ribosyltransferase